jgi:hypothetical protein
MNRITPILSELKSVSSALEKSMRENRISQIEKDILLEKLRRIYEALLNPEFWPGAEQTDVLSAYLSDNEIENEISEAVRQEKPIASSPVIDRRLIESLYGDAEPEPADQTPVPEKMEVRSEESDSAPTWNESLSAEGNARDLASVLASQTNSRLRTAIGLNDRLMFLADLFDNDNELYERTIDKLENTGSFDDACIYLYENFTVDDSKEGVKRLIALLESKFS